MNTDYKKVTEVVQNLLLNQEQECYIPRWEIHRWHKMVMMCPRNQIIKTDQVIIA